MFILNGFAISDVIISKIDPSEIKSIVVLKDATAAEQAITKGRNVIIIDAKQEIIDDLTKQGFFKPIL